MARGAATGCATVNVFRPRGWPRNVLTVFGVLLASLAALVLATELHAFSGVTINVSLGVEEIYLIVIVTLAGALAGLIPALEAYRTEAAKQLSSNV